MSCLYNIFHAVKLKAYWRNNTYGRFLKDTVTQSPPTNIRFSYVVRHLSHLQGYVFTVAYKQYVGSHISYSVWQKIWLKKMFLYCFKLSHANGDGEEKNGVELFIVGAKDEAHGKNTAICFLRRAEHAGQEQ